MLFRSTRWPRATVVRRAGAARRRTHTVIGAGLATAALVVSGSLVATGSGAEATSLSEEKAGLGITVHSPSPDTAGSAVVDEATLLTADQTTRFGRGLDWQETATAPGGPDAKLLAPCQRAPLADRHDAADQLQGIGRIRHVPIDEDFGRRRQD